MTAASERTGTRLEVDDIQHCKGCGLEIEVNVRDFEGLVWDAMEGEWVEIERCAACEAAERLKELAHIYECRADFDVSVRGMNVETEVIRR